MFDNVGDKIKGVAKVFCWLGIIVSVLVGIVLMMVGVNTRNGEMTFIVGIVITVVGSLLSWIGSLITYGIGELVQNSCILTELAVKQEIKGK